jgi:hypothetical protein
VVNAVEEIEERLLQAVMHLDPQVAILIQQLDVAHFRRCDPHGSVEKIRQNRAAIAPAAGGLGQSGCDFG